MTGIRFAVERVHTQTFPVNNRWATELGRGIESVVVSDFDNDGLVDKLVVDGNRLLMYRGQPSGLFSETAQVIFGARGKLFVTNVSDQDDDRDIDLTIAEKCELATQGAKGVFTCEVTYYRVENETLEPLPRPIRGPIDPDSPVGPMQDWRKPPADPREDPDRNPRGSGGPHSSTEPAGRVWPHAEMIDFGCRYHGLAPDPWAVNTDCP